MSKVRSKSLTIQQKLQIIDEIERDGDKRCKIALKYNIPPSTLCSIWKNKERLKSSSINNTTRFRIRSAKFEPLDKAILDFFNNSKSQNIPLTCQLIKQKALQFSKDLNIENFCASNGWLYSFKERYGISLKQPSCTKNNNTENDSKNNEKLRMDSINLLNEVVVGEGDGNDSQVFETTTPTIQANGQCFDKEMNNNSQFDYDVNVNYFLDVNLTENTSKNTVSSSSPTNVENVVSEDFENEPDSDGDNEEDDDESCKRDITDQNMREAIETLFFGFTQKSGIPDTVFQSLNFMTTLVDNK